MEITALLLAGGQSQRMGKDKRFLEYQGRPLVRRAFEAAQAISDEIWVLIAQKEDEQLLSPLLGEGVRFFVDAHPNSGPLGALAGALPQVQSEYALLLAVDYPLITGPFLQRMRSVLEAETVLPDIFVPLYDRMPQVTCAFYQQSLNKELQDAFAAGERSLRHWVMGLPPDRVRWLPDEESKKWGFEHVFLNVNTQQDYELLLELSQSPFEKWTPDVR